MRAHKGHHGESMPISLLPFLTRLMRITVVSKASAITVIVRTPDDAGDVMMIECSCCWESLQKQ